MLPLILVTPGEPAGIGPDIVIQQATQAVAAKLVCVGNPDLLQQRALQLGVALRIETISDLHQAVAHQPGQLQIYPVALGADAEPGTLNPANAQYVLQCLDSAVQFLKLGQAQALVTGPVHKGIINDASIAFTGHTEYLAELTHSYPVMMLTAGQLRVALATTHLPLADVSTAISHPLLQRVIEILHHDLIRRFAIPEPRILVAGLNPHAGEGGHLGREEIEIIEPVLNDMRNKGINVIGPLPADTLFTPNYLEKADAVLAMYHDQGLPVLKHVGFGNATNVTLGLPIVRTSVDHGTALDLAGTGKADTGSLHAAIEQAIDICNKQVSS